MTSITPFTVNIEQQQLDDLALRLRLTRWPEQETVIDWCQGAPLKAVKDLVDYWQHDYDWRRCERRLNQYPQFVTTIDGLPIHFMHIQSPHDDATPMIMTHGWPGSIIEFLEVIEPLTNPTAHGGEASDAFHLVIPSLPGFGFSGKPVHSGWNLERIANAWITLMERLEYRQFVAQGGDWGSAVTSTIGKINPPSCLGIHLNLVIINPVLVDIENLTQLEQTALAKMEHYERWDSGYSKQQSTRPQTVGYSLVDSPVGLASWIYEKYFAWTDNNGKPEDVLSYDQMLDNIMIYWLNATGASSARLYWESFNSIFTDNIDIPTGISLFPKEIFLTSERWAEKVYTKLHYWNECEKGGHFAAFEQPNIFISEVRSSFRSIR
ncbi:epoxide hydrolase [Aestuariicella hydrocarbonica]|uniref:Epoxide hydrolase n=1 Tax=Pseudomaricurvus hydrocarbonicus TaxID=1470433 RepID=A0A9E5JQR7_9GAMM|nr:epoxide hydrolase family protein [Aestuariicella hydrocarbonica]NHO64769.1 epoxide hydrolase [Aestuariicella hydrocarbonica]